MQKQILCAPRKPSVISTASASFQKARIDFDVNFGGGRSASLKHFGFNASPPRGL